MKKIILLIMMITGLAAVSCTTNPDAVSGIAFTNYVQLFITNTPDHIVDVDMMNAVKGEWLVTLETYTDQSNATIGGTNVVAVHYVQTNTYDSVTNGGYDGAFSFFFKPDFFVDKIVYNSQGGVLSRYTNAYKYSILSNESGLRMALSIAGYYTKTTYLEPVGPYTFLTDPLTNIQVKTNIGAYGALTNVSYTTNVDYLVVSQTNYWQQVIEVSETTESYEFQFLIQGNETNSIWTPDLNYFNVMNSHASTLSIIQDTANQTVPLDGGSSTESVLVDFQLYENNSYMLKKIK